MTSTSVHYLCPHTTPISAHPPRFEDLSAPSILGIHYHPLSSLLFCEECDAVRCDQCVGCELNCYYCPNCLFEVPAANIRSQKNRCSRNCFLCPQCQNTLSAVATDPPTSSFNDDYKALESSVGVPPYFLSCSFCRWDSKQVGISFEKPTFLAQQLTQAESSPSELLEFDKLKEHFEGYLKSQSLPNSAHYHINSQRIQQQQPVAANSPAHLAASLALSKQVPNLTRYGSQLGLSSSNFKLRSNHSFLNPNHHHHHSHINHLPANANPDGSWREDLPVYQSLFPQDSSKRSKLKNQSDRIAFYRHGDQTNPKENESDHNLSVEQITPIEKKWDQVWDDLDRVEDLKPNRVPLRSKRTKRCPTCQHILIKPEQKAQSIRFKIKLIASNYLPYIELHRKRATTSSKLGADRLTSGMSAARKSAAASRTGASAGSNPLLGRVGEPVDEVIRPDRRYQFEMTFSNPLYESINVRLLIPPATPLESTVEGEPAQLPYQINLLASEFTIAAFAEVWEYDDEDQAEDGSNEETNGQKDPDEPGSLKRNRLSTFGLTDPARRRSLHINPVSKKANRTTILLEAKTHKHFVGTLQADMLVTFTYRSDDLNDELEEPPAGHHTSSHLNRRKGEEEAEDEAENQKSFTFWTKLTFGEVVPSLTGLQPTASTILDSATSSQIKKKVANVPVSTSKPPSNP